MNCAILKSLTAIQDCELKDIKDKNNLKTKKTIKAIKTKA